jgi:hypothetical protein
MMGMKDVAVSAGSACTGFPRAEPRAAGDGVGDELVHSSIRFGFGRFTTLEEVDYAVDQLVATVRRLREHSPGHEMAHGGPTSPGGTDETIESRSLPAYSESARSHEEGSVRKTWQLE